MNPPLTADLVAEVLDDVRHVDLVARDRGLLEPRVQHGPGGTDEHVPLEVLLVAGHLADQHQACVLGALAHDRLGRALPQVAGATALDGLAQRRVGEPVRDRWGRAVGAQRTHSFTGLPER